MAILKLNNAQDSNLTDRLALCCNYLNHLKAFKASFSFRVLSLEQNRVKNNIISDNSFRQKKKCAKFSC